MAQEVIDRNFTFRGGNREAFLSRKPEVLNESGAGTGKSFTLMAKSNYWARRCPGARILWLRKERTSLNVVLDEFEKEILWPGHPAIHGSAHYTNRRFYQYPNGAEIWLGGLDRADKLMSSKWDLVCVFEATDITLEDWEKILSRLRSDRMPFRQAIADCNPKQRTHWLNMRAKEPFRFAEDPEIREGQLRQVCEGDKQMHRCRPRHEDNPAFHTGETWTPLGLDYMSKLWSLDGHNKERLLFHRWISAEGLVWPNFDASVHVQPMELKQSGSTWYLHAPRIREKPFRIHRFCVSGDKGWTNPGTLALWALDPDGRAFRVHEAYHTERGIEWWADILYEWHKRYGIWRGWYEPAEPEYIRQLNDRISAPTGRDGHRIVAKANNAFMAGRDEVHERLQVRPDGLCRLYVNANALIHAPDPNLKGLPQCFEDEVEGYMWREMRPTEDRPRDEDCGKDNHACDDVRYFCMGVRSRASELVEIPSPDLNYYEQDLADLNIGF